METLDTLSKDHNGKVIIIKNRSGRWWNHRDKEVQKTQTDSKFIYLFLK